MKILSSANQAEDIVSKEYVDGQINNHVHDADEIPCNTKVLKLGSKEYKISENLQNALENLLDYVYMNASGVLDLQTNLKSVSDTVSKIPAYKGGTGISIAGDTIGHSNNILPGMVGTGEILTPDFGDTVYTTWFSYDAQGHVTQSGTGGFVIPTVQADDSLSDTSTNPPQNKAVKAKFDAVDSQISSLGIDNNSQWTKINSKADNTAEGATALLGNLSESTTAPGDEDEVIIKNLNQYTRRPLTKLFDWIKANLAKVATSGSYSDLKDKPTIPKAETTLTSENLNDIKTPGFYNSAGGNKVTNKPSGADAFGLVVVHCASGAFYTQILYTNATSYRRYCVKGTWGSWTLDKFTDTTYTSLKNPYALTLQGNGTTLTNGTYDGSAAKTVNITPANIGAASSTHNHDNTYLKKSAVTSQSVIYTSTTSANSATITGLFTNYSLIWLQVVGSKTTHTHIVPLAYLKSKGSLMFKDSGVPFNIIKDSDTSIRWFEYQGQGAETYTSVTIVKII